MASVASTTKDCPCGSGARYAACCGPLHEGTRTARTPEELMRSRYAAFALGRGKYLVETLASAHPDLATPRDALERELGRARERQRFMGLSILHNGESGDDGEVLFFARIFERGRELSFAELSSFIREDGAWRYLSGIALPRAKLGDDPTALDRDSFLAIANESR